MLTKLFAALMTVIVCFGGSAVYTELPLKPSPQRAEMTVVKTDTLTVQEVSSAERTTAAETYIDAERAEEIVLELLALTREEVRFDRTELDFERGKRVYEVELWSDGTEYDFEIDALTGEVLRQKQETERRPQTEATKPEATEPEASKPEESKPQSETAELTEEQAVDTALSHAGLAREQITRLKVNKDRDDGVWIYEIEFRDGRMEYEYEIRVSDGTIVDWDKEYDD